MVETACLSQWKQKLHEELYVQKNKVTYKKNNTSQETMERRVMIEILAMAGLQGVLKKLYSVPDFPGLQAVI